MKRDFSNESVMNLALRSFRSLTGRLRGYSLSFTNTFSKRSFNLYFASYPRIINSKSITLGNSTKFGLFARIECYSENNKNCGEIHIGKNCSFGDYVHIGSSNEITIGDYVLAGSHILIIDHSHGSPKEDMLKQNQIPPIQRVIHSKDKINISRNVWLADGVIILAGADIGEGAIIAANSIVKGKVPAYSIYGLKK